MRPQGTALPFILLTALLLIRCDGGLAPNGPEEGPGYVRGLITYRNWPPSDSLRDLRIVLFKTFPPDNIVSSVLSGNAVVYPPLGDTSLVPFYVDSLRFGFSLPAGTYPYVIVAQQYGPAVTRQWRPVGQYDLDSDLAIPSPVTIVGGDTLSGVDIAVDFDNPPPMPFR